MGLKSKFSCPIIIIYCGLSVVPKSIQGRSSESLTSLLKIFLSQSVSFAIIQVISQPNAKMEQSVEYENSSSSRQGSLDPKNISLHVEFRTMARIAI